MSCIGRMFFIQILYSNWIWIYKELKCLLLVFFSHDFWVPLELARFVTIFLVLVSARNFHTGEPKKMALVRGLISIRLHWLVGAPLMTLGLLPVSRRLSASDVCRRSAGDLCRLRLWAVVGFWPGFVPPVGWSLCSAGQGTSFLYPRMACEGRECERYDPAGSRKNYNPPKSSPATTYLADKINCVCREVPSH